MAWYHGYEPQGDPDRYRDRTLIPSKLRGIISMLMQDKSICKFQCTYCDHMAR